MIEFTTIDLRGGAPEVLMDLELGQIFTTFCPLYVMVTDNKGLIRAGANIWMAGDEVNMAQTSGQGAFLAAPEGHYTLHASLDDYAPKSQEIDLKKAPLTTGPSVENTILIPLGN